MLWEKKGAINTASTVEVTFKKARELGIKYLIVASCTGKTAKYFLNCEFQIICVTHHVGYRGPGIDEIDANVRQYLQGEGVKILTTTHLLAGVDRSLNLKFGGLYPAEIIAYTLRILGQGVKVCVEIAIMALDAGLIPYGEEIIAVGGSAGGADTACVIVPDHSNNFFDSVIKEIICMPREK